MAKGNCPNINSPEWKELTDKVGTHEAWKMYYKYDTQGHPDPVARSITQLNKAVSEKLAKLQRAGKQFRLIKEDKGEKSHFYRIEETGDEIDSVSAVLDAEPGLKFQGSDTDERHEGKKYSDVGTEVHAVWEDAINIEDPNLIHKILTDKHGDKIPESYIREVINFVGKLKDTGTVKAETIVGYQGENEIDAVAGTIDIVHFKNDGSVHIYDVKTVHQTQEGKKKEWDVQEDGAFKAKRYSAQVVFYGELLSRTIGHPVTSYNILPAEISYNNVDNLDEGISSMNFVEPENIEKYDQLHKARSVADRYFGNKTKQSYSYKGAADVSDAILEKMTGVVHKDWGRISKDVEEADDVLTTKFMGTHGDEFYIFDGKTKKLNSHDPAEQRQQVLTESILPARENSGDIFYSIMNYIEKGTDATLDRSERGSVIKTIVDEYKNSNFKATQLNTLKGFEEKVGWILLSNGNRRDLIYTGKEVPESKVHMMAPDGSHSKKNSLFGHLDNKPGNRYEKNLKNTLLDLKKVEATLIAAQLLKDNDNLSIGKMSITSEYSSKKYSAVVNPIEVLEALDGVANDAMRDPEKVDPRIDELLEVDRSRFTIDAIEAYIDMIQSRAAADVANDVDTSTADGLKDYIDGKYSKQEVSDALLNEIQRLKSNKTGGAPTTNEEYLLSQAYFGIQDIDIWDDPIGKLRSKFATRNDLPGKVMGFINQKISTQITKFREEYWDGYKRENEKKVNAFISHNSKGATDWVADRTVSQTTRYYEQLFVHRNMVNEDGETKKVRVPELISEDSKEYKALSPENQEYHGYLINQFAKAAERAGMKNWDPYKIPLMRSSNLNSVYKLGRRETSIGAASERFWEGLTDNFEFVGQPETGIYRANNWFKSQNKATDRNNLAGYIGNEIFDQKKFESFETNLEVVLDMFTMNASRVHHMNKLAKMLAAAHSVYDFKATNLIDPEFVNNAQWINDMETIIIQNKDLDAGTVQNKLVKLSSRYVSSMTLGYNYASALAIGLGQELLLLSRTLANTWIGDGASVKDYGKAGKFMVKNVKLTSQLIDKFGLVDMDSSSLMSGVRRSGNKSWFQSKYQFGMLQFGDKVSKGQYLIADMINDGSIKAYSLQNGELVYNEDLDPRFTGSDGIALKEYLKKNMEEDGTLVDGRMTRGYDFKMAQAFSHKLTRIFGGYDRDTRAVASYSALGKLFFMHKNFLPAIMGRMTRSKTISDIEGKLEYYTDPQGKRQVRWTSEPSEGLLVSALAAMRFLMNIRDQPKPLEQYQKDNLKVLAADMMVWSLGFGFASMIASAFDDDDEWGKLAHKVALGGLRDMSASYDLTQIENIFKPVVVDYSIKTIDKLFSFPEGGSTLHDIVTIPAIGKQLDNINNLITD